jgi:ligand-binding sensor domain-containing protein
MLFSIKSKLFILFLCFSIVSFSQTLPCKNITINDGLPSNNIKCIFKDSRGVLWIGTEDGLCSYNGKEYKIYNEENGLKSNNVWSIAEDNQHNLWFALYGEGITKFDGKKFSYYNTKNGLLHNGVRKIYFSNKYNCLIIGTENGLSLFDSKKFKSFTEKTLIDKFQVMGINEDENRILISVNWHKSFSLKIAKDISKSKLIEEFVPIPSFSSFLHNNTYYSGGSDGFLYKRNLINNKVSIKPCNKIWDFAFDNSNTIYCASWNVNDPNGGLYKLSNDKLIDITKKANIYSTSLWCLYYDKTTEQLWVGSTDKGIFIVDLGNKIKSFEPHFFGLQTLEIQSLFTTKENTTWIGARDNIIILKNDLSYNILTKKYISIKVEKYIQKIAATPEQLNGYKSFKTRNGFTCFNITSDKDENIWVNTTNGTFCFDNKYHLLFYDFGSGSGGNIAFDQNDTALFSIMYNKTCRFKNKFDWTSKTSNPTNSFSKLINIQKICPNGENIWYGSYTNGLYLYKNDTLYSMNKNNQFHEKNIRDIIVDNKKNLLIGTNLGNVYVYSFNNSKLNLLKKYKSNIDIIGNTITFIEEINGYYFIGTNKGINILKNHKLIKLLNESEGLVDLQINDCLKDAENNLILATNNGLIKINTSKFITDFPSRINKIEINEIKVNGANTIFNKHLVFGTFISNKIELNYSQNDIEIYFSTNNLFNADKNVYRYKIEGLDNRWSNFESIDKINLRGLANGIYTITIEGKNMGTSEKLEPRIIQIEITPPFWKTPIFIFSVIVLFIVIAYLIIRKRIKQIEQQSDIQSNFNKRLAETKMEALQSQMNPHFIFNAMNSIQNFIIDSKTDDALLYMGEFSKLIRQTLNNSSKPLIKLADEIQYLKTYINIERMRFPYGIEFNLEVDKSVDINKIEIPPMIIQPFIENVFVHAFDSDSKGAKLNVEFSLVNGELHCRVEDNGNGIDKSKLHHIHESKGIKLVQERIELFQNNKKNIVISSKINKGTIVFLKFKITS